MIYCFVAQQGERVPASYYSAEEQLRKQDELQPT